MAHRASDAGTWLEYLIDFLTPGAFVASRRDTRELHLVRIVHNEVSEPTLRPPDPQFFHVEPTRST